MRADVLAIKVADSVEMFVQMFVFIVWQTCWDVCIHCVGDLLGCLCSLCGRLVGMFVFTM